jgi:hypothetical protein
VHPAPDAPPDYTTTPLRRRARRNRHHAVVSRSVVEYQAPMGLCEGAVWHGCAANLQGTARQGSAASPAGVTHWWAWLLAAELRCYGLRPRLPMIR